MQSRPDEIRLGLGRTEQVRSVDVQRVGRRLGQLTSSLMSELDDALRLHLSL